MNPFLSYYGVELIDDDLRPANIDLGPSQKRAKEVMELSKIFSPKKVADIMGLESREVSQIKFNYTKRKQGRTRHK